jgi:hypothetical protein
MQMARGKMSALGKAQRRLLGTTAVEDMGIAGMKSAALAQ